MAALTSKPKGFSLLEMLIAVTIFSLVMALSVTVFTSITTNSRAQRQEAIGRQEVNNSLELLLKEIALVGYNRNKDDIDTAELRKFVFWADIDNNSNISLDNNPGNDEPRVEKVTVQWDSDTGEFTRTEDQGSTIMLVDNVENCKFEYFDRDGVKIDEDGNSSNGQQITQQKTRDEIRRIQLTLTTRPYETSSQEMTVMRDIYLPNMDIEQVEECGRIAIDSFMTIKACDPPGERGQVTITTYDKNGDRTDANNVLFSVIPSGSLFENEDESELTDNTLLGTVRDSRELVYFEPDTTEAGTEYTVSAEWTPAEDGCWKRMANAMMRVVAGDPCTVQFVDAPDEIVVCNGDDFDPGVNVEVAVSDMCGNFVPNAVIQVQIVGNDYTGSMGTIEGSPARPEIRSDQYGKAYFKYRPPETVWPEDITLKATVVGDLASESCDPSISVVFPLLANNPTQIQKYTPSEPILYDDAVDMAIQIKDSCGNVAEGLTGIQAGVANYNPLYGNYLSDVNNVTNNGVATLTEVDAAGNATPGIYWFRMHPGNGGFSSMTVGLSHANFDGGYAELTYSMQYASGCSLLLESTPESVYGSGLPYNSETDDVAHLKFQGYHGTTHAKFSVTLGMGEMFTDAAATVPYTSDTFLTPDANGEYHLYVRNSMSIPTPVGGAVSVRAEDYYQLGSEYVKGFCDESQTLDVVCSSASVTIKNESGLEVDQSNAWDPTLSTSKLFVTVVDKNQSGAPYTSFDVKVVTDKDDNEWVTVTNGATGGSTYTNTTGVNINDIGWGDSRTNYNNAVETDLIGTMWVTYTDATALCGSTNDSITEEAPVDGCVDLFVMDFEDTPSDSGTWSESYKTFSDHADWSYEDLEKGTPSGVGPSSCPSGKCYGTDLDGNYGSSGSHETYLAYLTRETSFQITGLTQAFMVYDIYLDMGSGESDEAGACLWMERKVGTNSWNYRAMNSGAFNDKADKTYTGFNKNKSCWGGDFTGGEWAHVVYPMRNDISKKQGKNLYYRFAFLSTADDFEDKPGFYVDNVRVCGSTRGD